MGNVIGSNIFNLLAVLSIPAIIYPIKLAENVLTRDYAIMFASVVLVFLMGLGFRQRYRLGRFYGGVLVAVYVGYIFFLYLTA